MLALKLIAPRTWQRTEVPSPPAPGAGEVLVRSHRMGVCGTDISAYLGKFPFFDYPRIPGHELGVEVLELGAGVEHLEVGAKCSVEPYLHCGSCHACRRGATNCCRSLNVIGVMSDGGLCERFVIPAEKLHASETLSYDQLALVETLGIGCHAVQRAQCQDADRVLVIGAGPIGLSVIEFVKLTGAELMVLDMNPSRLAFCREQMGVKKTLLLDDSTPASLSEMTDGCMPDVIFDATGNVHSMRSAFQLLAPTGRLVLVGITTEEIGFQHPPFHKLEGTLLCSRNALAADFRRIIGLIESNTLDTRPWITHRVAFDEVEASFEGLLDPKQEVVKAVIEIV